MLLCPRCTVELVGERRHDGNVFVCPTCGGEAATIAVLRKRLTTDAVNELWRRARTATRRGERPCPACHDAMVEVGVHAGAREAVVDACARCQMAWFDAGELEVVPAKPPPPAPAKLSPEAAEAWAKLVTRPPEDSTFERVETGTSDFYAGLAGAPTKVGAPERDGRPWVTWALAAAILALTVIPIFRDGFAAAFSRKHDPLLDLARAWGFVPADAWRHGGLTLVTCFFLHGGWLHALWNTYFLVLTGEDLEGVLGRGDSSSSCSPRPSAARPCTRR